MTIRSRSPETSLTAKLALRVAGGLLAVGCLYAQTSEPGSFPLVKSCATGAEVAAALRASDAVSVRYSFSGDAGTCYAVTATVDAKSVSGYLIGAAHPAVQAFIHEVQSQGQVIPPPPPPAPPAAPGAPKALAAEAKAAPAPEAPVSFAGFRAVTIDGWPVDLGRERAANVVIYFWSARNRASIRAAEGMELISNTYHPRGVYVVGVGSAGSAAQLKKAVNENELDGPQVLDRGGLAARYHVDPAKPFLILDQRRNVIAAAANAGDLEPILAQITKGRRARL